MKKYTKLIKLRRSKHYYDRFASIYEALYYTVKIHEFYKEHRQGISQGRAIDLYQAYVNEYHLMDTYYRKFYVAYDEESNHDLLKKLKMEKIKNAGRKSIYKLVHGRVEFPLVPGG